MSMMLGQRIKRLEDRIAALEAQMEVVKNVSLEYVQKKPIGRPKKSSTVDDSVPLTPSTC